LVIQKKQLKDELQKRQASKPKAGAIITKAEIVGRRALDKALKAKLARKEKAKEKTAKKRKRETYEKIKFQKRPRYEVDSSGCSEGEQEELEESGDISEVEAGGENQLDQRNRNPAPNLTLGEWSNTSQPAQVSGDMRRNPSRTTRCNQSLRVRRLDEYSDVKG
jgi:hypothetical protein